MVAQSLNGALEEIELDGDNCHYQKIMMMEMKLQRKRGPM